MKTVVEAKQNLRYINHQMILLENLYSDIEIKPNKRYHLDLKEVKETRTLKQNSYMWALIREIARHDSQQMEMDEIYSSILEEADAESEIVYANPEAESMLRKGFRAVKVLCNVDVDGKTKVAYKCFIGSSRLNTSEMNKVIDIAVSWARELGIETNEEYYSE